jgi:gas vesicle protein
MDNRKSTEMFTAFAIGIGVGALVGILFAPQSGEETRDYIVKGARNRYDDAVDTGRQYVQRAQDGVDQAKEYARNVVETGKDYVRRAQDGVNQVAEQAKEQVQTQIENASETADRVYRQVRDAAEAGDRAYHKAKGA